MPDPFHIPTIDEVAPAKAAAPTAHTPGPWRLHLDGPPILRGTPDYDPTDGYRCIEAGGGMGAPKHGAGFYLCGFLSEADARLIAAAPELIDALRLFVRQWNACGPNSDFGRYFKTVRDAAVLVLAKATGDAR